MNLKPYKIMTEGSLLMKKTDIKTVAFSIRLPEDMKAELEKIAEREHRSVNNCINLAVQEYVRTHKKKQPDI